MSSEAPSIQRVEPLIKLAKLGDPASLKQLRIMLGKTQEEIAGAIGLPEDTVGEWEEGKQQPESKDLARWRIALASYIDGEINAILGTKSSDITMKFWALMWELTK